MTGRGREKRRGEKREGKRTEMEKRGEMEAREKGGGDKVREIMDGKEGGEESVDSKH